MTSTTSAIAALEHPEQADMIKRNTKAKLNAAWAGYLAGTRAGDMPDAGSQQVVEELPWPSEP